MQINKSELQSFDECQNLRVKARTIIFKYRMQEEKDQLHCHLGAGKRAPIGRKSQEEIFNTIRKKLKHSSQELENPYEQIPQIPNIHLSVKDMNSDPVQLLAQLEQKYRQFGAVKLTSSQCWNCPFTFRYVDKGITTRIQCLQKLKQGKAFEQNVEAYSIKSYQAFANNFEKKYSFKSQIPGTTLEAKKEFEYWGLVTKDEYSKNQVRVEYAADLPALKYGSGFPTRPSPNWKDSDFVYEENLFNLNNILKSPSSILAISQKRRQKVSGITHPWVYMGMLFSTFCWHVEDLWVNSLNYSHKGSIKTWYIIPGEYKDKFDDYVRKHYCLSSQKKTLLERITFMIDPLELIKAGIPVYKTYQRARDFVCTFFKAYHCGFSQGYNVGQAVNFMSPLSIYHMKKAQQEKLKAQRKPTSVIPVEWVIYENYLSLDKFPKYRQHIETSYKEMLKREQKELNEVLECYKVESVQVFQAKVKYDKFFCAVCKDYLYLHTFKLSSQPKKHYCHKHLFQTVEKKTKIVISLREPNNDRNAILDLINSCTQKDRKKT